jgi:hypothetical protein
VKTVENAAGSDSLAIGVPEARERSATRENFPAASPTDRRAIEAAGDLFILFLRDASK